MKLSLRQVIERELISVCKDQTAIIRTAFEKTDAKKKFTKTKVDKVKTLIRVHWSGDSVDRFMEAMSVLFDAPELFPALPPLELFSVVVVEANSGNHVYNVNQPLIVTKKSPLRLMYVDGNCDCGYSVGPEDKVRPATDEEVESCIRNLNASQWNTVMAVGGMFKDIVGRAMDVEVSIEPVENGDTNGEVVEAGDRRISMS